MDIAVLNTRINAVRNKLLPLKADAVLISNPRNVFYLSGFSGISPTEKESALLITEDAATLFIPKMYEEHAKQRMSESLNYIEIKVDEKRLGFLPLIQEKIKTNTSLIVESNSTTMQEHNRIQEILKLKIVGVDNLIEDIRTIKDEEEISFISKAVQLTDETYETFIKLLQLVGYTKFTELDCVEKIREISRSIGGEGFGFEPVIASGSGSSQPHYSSSSKRLKKGELLLVDMGIKYKEYTGDLTRCISLGSANNKVKKIYDAVLECNTKCTAASLEGVTGEELYSTLEKILIKHKLDPKMIHSLGHGVGLNIHEQPFLRPNKETVLKENMVLTIEPGIYFPGEFGVRIEDVVVIDKVKSTVLSKASNELEEI